MKTNLMLSCSLLGAVLAASGCAASKPDQYRVYFGTSTADETGGIFQSVLDMQTGRLSQPERAGAAYRTGFIAIHPDGKLLYSTGEPAGFKGKSPGSVSAFRITEPGGGLEPINTQPSGGQGPCHLIVDPAGKNVLVANYQAGSCAVLPIRADGALSPASCVQTHSGASVHPQRQTKAYAHSINLDAAGRIAIVADLGIDRLMLYRFDPAAGTLTPNDPPFVQTEPGGGPRHFCFHPSGTFAYANLELSNEVTVFRYAAGTGALAILQRLSTLPDGFKENNTTAEVRVTPDGRFLYVSNRGHNSIAIFAIDQKTGLLTARGYESTRGAVPRNFNIDPTGTYLVAANQDSNNVVVFRIDRQTGALTFTGSEITVPKPICVRFLALAPR